MMFEFSNHAGTVQPMHWDMVLWDLRKLSIFFPEPLQVRLLPGPRTAVRTDRVYEVGCGYGGISELFTQRGEDCIEGCGDCCRAVKYSAILWYDAEEPRYRGEGVLPVDILVNNRPLRVWLWPFKHLGSCAFLETDTGRCQIHSRGRAMMCHFGPQTGLYKMPKSDRLMLSRRIVSRNWRWPKCPIDVSKVPFTPKTVEENDLILRTLAATAEVVDDRAGQCAKSVREYLGTAPHFNKGRILLEDFA